MPCSGPKRSLQVRVDQLREDSVYLYEKGIKFGSTFKERVLEQCKPNTSNIPTSSSSILSSSSSIPASSSSIPTNQSINQNAKPAMPKGHSGPSTTRPLLMNRSHTTPCRPTIWIPLVQVNHLGHKKHCNTTSSGNIPTSSSNIPSIPTSSSNIPASPSNIQPSSSNIPTSTSSVPTSSGNIPTSSSSITTSSGNISHQQPNILTVPPLPRTFTCMKEFYNIWKLDFKPLYDQYKETYGRIHSAQLYDKQLLLQAKLYAQRYSHISSWLDYLSLLNQATCDKALDTMVKFCEERNIQHSVCIKKVFHQIVKPEITLDQRYQGLSSQLSEALKAANLPKPDVKRKQDHSKRNKQTTQSDDIPMEIDENIFWDVVKQLDYLNNYEKYKHNFGKVAA